MRFKDKVKNKRVVFVGACPNLKGTAYGEHIDSYDIVCKSNGSALFDSVNYYRDYGERLDCLYVNNQFYRECYKELKEVAPFIIDFLRMKACSFDHFGELRNLFEEVEIIKPAIQSVNQEVKGALMGLYMIKDILSMQSKELHLCGVDFFASKRKEFEHNNYREYLENYLPDKIRIQGNKINKGKTEDGHNFDKNCKYIYDIYMKDERLTMPGYLESLLIDIVGGKIRQQN